jgi:hypothetical protein
LERNRVYDITNACDYGSLGLPSTEDNCAASIDRREPSNEWHVHDYLPIGIFILLPIIVRQTQKIEGLDEPVSGEVALEVEQAIAPFPASEFLAPTKRRFWRSIASGADGMRLLTRT